MHGTPEQEGGGGKLRGRSADDRRVCSAETERGAAGDRGRGVRRVAGSCGVVGGLRVISRSTYNFATQVLLPLGNFYLKWLLTFKMSDECLGRTNNNNNKFFPKISRPFSHPSSLPSQPSLPHNPGKL